MRGRTAGSMSTSAVVIWVICARCTGAVAREVELPAGYSIAWSGQFEYLERATKRLRVVVPATLAIIFVLLFLTFREAGEAALIMASLHSRSSVASG